MNVCNSSCEPVDPDEVKKKNLKKMLLLSICLASNLGGKQCTVSGTVKDIPKEKCLQTILFTLRIIIYFITKGLE